MNRLLQILFCLLISQAVWANGNVTVSVGNTQVSQGQDAEVNISVSTDEPIKILIVELQTTAPIQDPVIPGGITWSPDLAEALTDPSVPLPNTLVLTVIFTDPDPIDVIPAGADQLLASVVFPTVGTGTGQITVNSVEVEFDPSVPSIPDVRTSNGEVVVTSGTQYDLSLSSQSASPWSLVTVDGVLTDVTGNSPAVLSLEAELTVGDGAIITSMQIGPDLELSSPDFFLSQVNCDGRSGFVSFISDETLVSGFEGGSFIQVVVAPGTGFPDPVIPVSWVTAPFTEGIDVTGVEFTPTFTDGSIMIRSLRGDANLDDTVDIGDVIYILQALFGGGDPLWCPGSGDANSDFVIDISDPIFLLSFLFGSGAAPSPEVADCSAVDLPFTENLLGPTPPEEDPGCGGLLAGPGFFGTRVSNNCFGTWPVSELVVPVDRTAPGEDPVEGPGIPLIETRTEVPSWIGGSAVGIMGPTADDPYSGQGTSANVPSLATNLYEAVPGEDDATMGFLAMLKNGSVELGQLGFAIRDLQRFYPGANDETGLSIGWSYYSRSHFDGVGSIGAGFIHTFFEKLEFVDAGRCTIRHFSGDSPYNDSDNDFVRTEEVWVGGPAGGNQTLEFTSDWPCAAYKLSWRDGRIHYFNADGQILARVGRFGTNAIVFNRDPSGVLLSVTDTRGQVFSVTMTNGFISSIVDPEGNEIQYNIVNGQLQSVTYPEREVVEDPVSPLTAGPGCPPLYNRVVRTTQMSFEYEATNGRLITMRDDIDQVTGAVEYDPTRFGVVQSVTNARGGVWTFDDVVADSKIVVHSPRGFPVEYTLDADRQVIAVREFITGTDPNYPSRPIPPNHPGEYLWELVRDDPCNCGVITEIIEPDLGKYTYEYDAFLNVTEVKKFPNGGAGVPLTWTVTYNAQNRPTSFTPPHAYEYPDPSLYTYTTTIDIDSATGFEIYTLSTPAGNQHVGPVEWVWTRDTRHRLVEFQGPSHDGIQPGVYEGWEYYDVVTIDGANALLPRRHTMRNDWSIFSEYEHDATGNLLTATQKNVTNSEAYVFTHLYNSIGQMTFWTGPSRGDQQYQREILYDESGRFRVGRWYYYDSPPDLTPGAPPATGEWIEMIYDYNAAGEVVRWRQQVEGCQYATAVFDRDVSGNLIEVTDPDGQVSRATYDERDFPWQLTDAVGTFDATTREVFYTDDGDVDFCLDPFDFGSPPFNFDRIYDSYDRYTGDQSPGNSSLEDEFDASGRVIVRRSFDVVNGASVEIERTEFEYLDWHHGPTRETAFIFLEDGSQLLRTVTTRTEYGPSSRPRQMTLQAPAGTGPETVFAEFEYEPWGTPRSMTDGSGSSELFEYDAATGYLEVHVRRQFDPLTGLTVDYTRQITTDHAGRVTEVRYLAPGESDRVESFGYDSLDNLVSFVDPKGDVSEGTYRFDRQILTHRRAVTGGVPLSEIQYTYTTGGRLATIIDNRGNTVTIGRDGRGRKNLELNPDGAQWTWQFNPAGFMTSATTPTNKVISLAYNERGFPTSRTIEQGGQLLRTDQYLWTSEGFLKSAQRSEAGQISTVTFLRDSTGKVLEETIDGEVVTYERDAYGRLIRLTGPSGHFREYGYDDHHRVTQVRDGIGGTTAVLADLDYLGPRRALRQLQRRGGAASTLTVDRDGFGRVTNLSTDLAGSPLFGYEYGYDLNGHVRYENRTHDGVGDVYEYNGLYQVTRFIRDSVNPIDQAANPAGSFGNALDRQYILDADFHRQSVLTTFPGGMVDVEDYLTDPDRHHYTNIDGVVRTTDLDGKLLTNGSRSYSYSAADELIEVQDAGSVTASYSYDPFGRRIGKTVGGVTTRYIYAGPWMLEEWQESAGQAATLDAVHYHATGVDEVLMSKRRDGNDLDGDGNTDELIDLFLHRNRLGSVQDLTLENGTIVESYRYDAYGTPTIEDNNGVTVATSPSGNSFLFSGREYDAETGYYYYRARYLDPATGAFLTEDPLGMVDSVNPVAYVLANPAMFVDPMGTEALADAVNELLDLIKENRELLGEATEMLLDLLGPLGSLLDLASGLSGYDLRGWIRAGFQGELKELGFWKRVALGAEGAVMGVLAAAHLVKVTGAIGRIKKLITKKQKCFVAGTLVLLAGGELVPIEAIEVGDVVACRDVEHPQGVGPDFESSIPDHYLTVTPEKWRVIELDVTCDDASKAQLVMLRPMTWVTEQQASVGNEIPISIPGLHLVGIGRVLSVTSCPEIAEQRPGSRVVLETIRREADDLFTLRLRDHREPFVTGTGEHPFYSATRQSWINLSELKAGEHLVTADGETVAVESVTALDAVTPVYNFSVHRSHTYYVGEDPVLVHNSHGGAPKGGTYKLRDPETGEVVRTGRAKDLKTREGQHARGEETKDLDFEVDRRTDDYAEQRGREHAIHEQHPEARHPQHPEGGTPGGLNKIRAIGPKNKNKQKYLDAETRRAARDDN